MVTHKTTCNNKMPILETSAGEDAANAISAVAIQWLIKILIYLAIVITAGIAWATWKLLDYLFEIKTVQPDTSSEDTLKLTGNKSRTGAGLLGIFLGPLGFHNFYLGGKRRKTLGFAQLVLSFVGVVIGNYLISIGILWGYLGIIGLLWGYIEGICILAGRKCCYGEDDQYLLTRRRGWKGIAVVIHEVLFVIMVLIMYYGIFDIIGGLI
ncbi:NINE protein [Candidatus Bathycorpusculum sp.]|uniref:NINE protein n=1 Tax=Candidatus Bathycorpusculum sp. TaxID=2994959 RepID=UPI002837E07C|nr:TM2 domain-containing protein [Candidatus Termitimicrobium sp.]MCL2432727.1 TM2 domain-containing protein [Candidatus Termitimicrobium sp.]